MGDEGWELRRMEVVTPDPSVCESRSLLLSPVQLRPLISWETFALHMCQLCVIDVKSGMELK